MKTRSGMGMLITLVLLVCGILGMVGVSAYLQSGGTGRARVRVLSIRSAIEAGDAALAEAAAAMRVSMDTGARSAACPDDWREILLNVIQGTPQGQTKQDPTGRTFRLVPVITRERLPTDDTPVTIGEVTAKVLNCYNPELTGSMPPNPPQGVIETSVTVKGPGKMFDVVRTVKQRRIFYAGVANPVLTGGQIAPESVMLYLTIDPIGTALQ